MPKGKTTPVTDVAVANQFTRDNIPDMLAVINQKISTLKGGTDKVASTAGKTLSGFGRLEDIHDVSHLILAYATVESRIDKYTATVKKLKLAKAPALCIAEVPATAWLTDIADRIATVTHKDELEKLEKAKALLEANLSQEQKLANDLAKIADIFSEE